MIDVGAGTLLAPFAFANGLGRGVDMIMVELTVKLQVEIDDEDTDLDGLRVGDKMGHVSVVTTDGDRVGFVVGWETVDVTPLRRETM